MALLLAVIAITAAILAYLRVTGYQKYPGPRAGEPHLRGMLKMVSVELSDDGLAVHLQNIGETLAEIARAGG